MRTTVLPITHNVGCAACTHQPLGSRFCSSPTRPNIPPTSNTTPASQSAHTWARHRKSRTQCCAAAARAASGKHTKAGKGGRGQNEQPPLARQQTSAAKAVHREAAAMPVHFFLAAALVTLPVASFFSTCSQTAQDIVLQLKVSSFTQRA